MNHLRGMTLIGMLLTVTIIVMLGIVVMRIVPVYLQHYSVTHSIDALKRIPKTEFTDDPSANASLLKSKLINQFDINSVDIPENKIKITPNSRGNFDVKVTYQVTKPLFANISLLFDFDDTHEVDIRGN